MLFVEHAPKLFLSGFGERLLTARQLEPGSSTHTQLEPCRTLSGFPSTVCNRELLWELWTGVGLCIVTMWAVAADQ